MVWSSAMTIRIEGSFLSIGFQPFLWNSDFQPGTTARSRFNHHVPTNSPDPLLDDGRPPAKIVELTQGESASKWKSPAVVINYQLPVPVLRPEAHQRRMRSAVLTNIDQALLYHPGQLAASRRRHRYFLQLRQETRGDSSVSGETFYELGNKVKKLIRTNVNRPHGLHQFTEV